MDQSPGYRARIQIPNEEIPVYRYIYRQQEALLHHIESIVVLNQQMNRKILGLRTAIYKVADVDAAKKWYEKVFLTQPYFDEPFYVGFNIGGYELGLQPEDEATNSKPESVLTYWGVEDITREYQRILNLGAVPHNEPENVGGEIMVASVKDSWGNIIGLIYNPEFKLSS